MENYIYENLYCVIMRKPKQEHKIYTNISRNESALLGTVGDSDLPVFGVEEVRALTGWKGSRAHNTLHSLGNKGLVTRIKRGRYALTELVSDRLFEIATETVKPSYISFWTALAHYGLTEQQPALVQLVSVRQSKGFRIGRHRVHLTTWRPERFYGYRKEGRFVIAEIEKALVDSLYQPDKCGGMEEYAKCLGSSWERLDKGLFLDYVLRFGNRSMVSRAGYLAELLGLDGVSEGLRPHAATGYVKLDPGGRGAPRRERRWKVMVNVELEGGP